MINKQFKAVSPKYISELNCGFSNPNAIQLSITDCGGFTKPKISEFALN